MRYRAAAYRRSPPTYHIVLQDGRVLSNSFKLPYKWSDRDMDAVAFRTKEAAEKWIVEKIPSSIRILRPRVVTIR